MQIKQNSIHIWPVQIDRLSADNFKQALLSEDEMERANRFRFDFHRQNFIATRSLLRQILAYYLNIQASCIRIDYDQWGKPYLAYPKVNLHFNLSHSGNQAYYAFAAESVGIDIEKITDDKSAVAARFFTKSENEEMQRLNKEDKIIAFYKLWTKKEALLKALGLGLSHSMNSFSLDWQDDVQTIYLYGKHLTVTTLPSRDDYQAALASETSVPEIEYYSFAEKLTS